MTLQKGPEAEATVLPAHATVNDYGPWITSGPCPLCGHGESHQHQVFYLSPNDNEETIAKEVDAARKLWGWIGYDDPMSDLISQKIDELMQRLTKVEP